MNGRNQILVAVGLLCLSVAGARAVTLTNWARAGIATQSSTLSNTANPVAAKAIDGNPSGAWGDASLTHTATGNAGEWWQVDLGGLKPIGHIHLWFREECCAERNQNLHIVVYDSTNVNTRVVLWETNNVEMYAGVPRDIGYNLPATINGSVVFVEHVAGYPDYVSLAEVEVFNQPLAMAALPNNALYVNGGWSISSSVYLNDSTFYGPQQANDGNRMGLTANNTTWGYSAPDDSAGADPLPWWRVDLAASQSIGSVVLWPRRDRSNARFEKIRLTVADVSTNTLYQQVFEVQPSGPQFTVNFVPALANGKIVLVETTTNTPDKFLNLPEVEVYPPLASAPTITFATNLAATLTATQATPTVIGPVYAVVDGGIRQPEISYRWFRNGAPIPGMAGSWMSSYTTPLLTLADNNAKYTVQASVSGFGVVSTELTLNVVADTVPPVVVTNSWVVTDQPYLNLLFSELLDPESATNLTHYSFEGGPTVASAALGADGKTVILTAGNVLLGDQMALNISQVKDITGNVMVPTRITGAFPSVSINYARAGVATQSSTYANPLNPIASKAIDGNTAGSWPAGSLSCTAGAGEYGWWEVDLTASKVLGTVVVWWRSDCCFTRNRNVDLVIYDKADPATRVEVLRRPVSGSTDPSNPVTLTLPTGTAGQVVHLEHTYETDTTDGANMQLCLAEVQVLPPPNGLVISSDPKSWNVYAGDRIFLRSTAEGTPPISYQWQRDGVDVAGATGLELAISNIAPAQAGIYTMKAVNSQRTRVSLPATVTVAPRPSLGASLVARYRFDTDEGTNVLDDAALNPAKTTSHLGQNRSATWVAEATDTNNVTRKGLLHFDGTLRDQQMGIPPHPDFDIPVGTICFWMKGLPADTVGNTGATLFDRRTAFGSGALGDSLCVAAPFKDPLIYADHEPGCLYNQNATTGVSVDGVTRLDDDAWHHVAFVFVMDPIGINTFFVDGKFEREKTDGVAGPWPTAQELEFGRSWDGWFKAYSGYLDDIHIFNRVLNQAELTELMTIGIPPALTASVVAGKLVLTWPDAGYILQENANVANTTGWADIPGATTSGVSVDLPAVGSKFYRLRKL